MHGQKVLITPRSFGKTSSHPMDILRDGGCEPIVSPSPRPVSVENLKAEIVGKHAFIVGIDPVPADVIAAADKLRVISKYGAGLDNIDLNAARKSGIVVTFTPGANSRAVAELTMGFVFGLARNLPKADRITKSGRWQRMSGIELGGRTFGIVGLGAIGRIVARLALGVGMKVVASDPFACRVDKYLEGVALVSLEELLKQSDFISLHVALTDETRGLINRENLRLVKDGAYLINTSRGEIADEAALAEALREGHLAGAALDVYQHEPPAGSPLLELENIITSPHMGAHTQEAIERMGIMAAQNAVSVLSGGSGAHIVP